MKNKKENNNILDEQTTRNKLINVCLLNYGPEGAKQLKLMFKKWDEALANCKNESEIKHMRTLACAEIYKAFKFDGGLTVGGKIIIPD